MNLRLANRFNRECLLSLTACARPSIGHQKRTALKGEQQDANEIGEA